VDGHHPRVYLYLAVDNESNPIMKKILLAIAVLAFTGVASAQQQPNFLFYQQNMSTINPAYAGTQGRFVGLNYRSAWQGIENAPRAATLVYNTSEKNNAAWGFTYSTDRVYVENQGVIAADYSYKLKVDENTNLFLGVKAGLLYNNIDLAKLNRITNEQNPALDGLDNYMNPLVGVGALLKGENFYVGASVPNFLNTERFKEVNGVATTATDKPHFYFTAGYELPINAYLDFNPSVLYRVVGAAPNQLTAIAQVTYMDKISAGLGVSNNDYISGLVMFHNLNQFSFGYGYEVAQRTTATALRANTHELVIRYQFD